MGNCHLSKNYNSRQYQQPSCFSSVHHAILQQEFKHYLFKTFSNTLIVDYQFFPMS